MPDPTFGVADTTDSDLGNFFQRPIKIAEYTWAINTPFYELFNPWSLYFNNKRVINRIANFNLMRCKLHVKFTINGNSFYYGRLLANYQPLYTYDTVTQDSGTVVYNNIEASQRPHIMIDPTTNRGGTLCLPFVWQYNALNIPNADWTVMGQMSIRTLQMLQHANGATDPVNISVFAWAEDVSLSIPTSQDPITIVPQSGMEGDEYSRAPISTAAAVAARAAAQLSNIPMLAPYALASEMVLSKVAAIAKMFGFSRPVVVSEIQSFRPTFGNYTNSNVPDNCHKLTLDVKQETTVDSRVVGLAGDDEMTIRSLATRESWLTSFPWAVSNVSEDFLFQIAVTPIQFAINPADFGYHLTPMAFATLPFKYWRGSMRYRFQVVSSGFHKGRLKFVYEPNVPATPGSSEYNTNYTQIVDISTTKDFTVTVGWGNQRPFLLTTIIDDTTILPFSVESGTMPNDTSHNNGYLNVYVVNELTVPMSTIDNDISINVFVSAGDDYEVVVPTDCAISNYQFFPDTSPGETLKKIQIEPQSGEEELVEVEDSRPMLEGDPNMIAEKLHGSADIYKVCFGDPIGSVRQVLKRYSTHSLMVPSQPIVSAFALETRPDFPYYPGPTVNGVDNSNTYNYSRMTLLNWFTPAFVCRRGGIRWKYVPYTMDYSVYPQTLNVQRNPCATSFSRSILGIARATTDQIRSAYQALLTMIPGGQVNPAYVVPAAEVELPFFINQRFWHGRNLNMTNNSLVTTFHDVQWFNQSADISSQVLVNSYCAAADDFSLSFFLCSPVMYLYSEP